MPESNRPSQARYRDPFTIFGARFGRGDRAVSFQLHEAGCRRFDAKWSFARVQSPFWRLYWNDRPGAWINCAGRRLELEPGHLLLVPAHTIFDTHGSPQRLIHFWIHFSLFPDLSTRDPVPISVPCRKHFGLAALARATRAAGSEAGPRLYHLCSALLHQAFASMKPDERHRRLPSKLCGLLDEIESSLDRPTAVTKLAARAGMSRGGFIRWFRRLAGVSPARYVMQRRIDHACRMLKFSPRTIEEIAEALGFANRNHFSRVFQKQMGLGPASFRRN